MKRVFLLLIVSLFSQAIFAQDCENNNYRSQEFKVKKYNCKSEKFKNFCQSKNYKKVTLYFSCKNDFVVIDLHDGMEPILLQNREWSRNGIYMKDELNIDDKGFSSHFSRKTGLSQPYIHSSSWIYKRSLGQLVYSSQHLLEQLSLESL